MTNKGCIFNIYAVTINYMPQIWFGLCGNAMTFMIFFFNYLLKEKGFKGWIHCFMQVLDVIQDPYLEHAHKDINIILAKD